MKILAKVIKDGKHVGFSIDDSGLLVQYPNKAIFSELVFMGLIADGYTFEGYSVDEIRDPAGKYISELPTVEFNADPDEWFSLNEIDVMPDAQCSKYYTVGSEAVQFKEAVNPTIKTREELIKFLDDSFSSYEKLSYSTDMTPLNSKVEKSALFDFEELFDANNMEAAFYLKNKLVRYCRSLIFKNFESKQNLINWLMEQGVLNTDTPSDGEFLKAYFSWGFPGIKTKCSKVTYKQADSNRVGSSVSNSASLLSGRVEVKTLMDADRNIYSGGNKYNLRNHIQSVSSDIVLEDDGKSLELLRKNMGGKQYTPVTIFERFATDKIVMEFITEKEYRFKIEFDCSCMCISEYQSSGWMGNIQENWFGVRTIIPELTMPFKEAKTSYLYELTNIAYAAALQLTKASIEPTPTKSSIDMVTKDGVNMISAINYLAHDISSSATNEYDSSKSYIDRGEGIKVRITDPLKVLAEDVPSDIISYFEEDIDPSMDKEQLSDFLEQFTIYPLKEGMQNDELPNLPADNKYIGSPSRDLETYRSELKFALDCFNGRTTVGAYGDGKVKDEVFDVQSIAKPFVTLALINKLSTKEAADVFQQILEGSDYFDNEELCRKQYNSYRGYFEDLGRLRESRAQSDYVLYVTKVIREISNKPAEEQRPYLLECAALNIKPSAVSALANDVSSVIRRADLSYYPDAIRNCITQGARFHALQLMMFICIGKINDSFKNEAGDYEIKLPTGTGQPLKLTISADLYERCKSIQLVKKYITLKDFCEKEFMSGGAHFNFFCINANVTPWTVSPKKGYNIPSVAFGPNYYKTYEYGTARKDWMTAVISAGGRLDEALHDLTDANMVIPNSLTTMAVMMSGKDEDSFWKSPEHGLPELEFAARVIGEETIKAYFLRWLLNKQALAAEGLTILSIPLKQDLCYSTIAPLFGVDIPDSEVAYTSDPQVAQVFLDDYKVDAVNTVDLNLIGTTKKVKADYFDIRNFDYQEIRTWKGLLNGTNKFSDIARLLPGQIALMKAHTIIDINSLTQDSLTRLADAGACFQLTYNKFLFQGVIRNFVVEVR